MCGPGERWDLPNKSKPLGQFSGTKTGGLKPRIKGKWVWMGLQGRETTTKETMNPRKKGAGLPHNQTIGRAEIGCRFWGNP